jgi:hypothetical protein
MNDKQKQAYFLGWRYQQTVNEIARLSALADELNNQLKAAGRDPFEVLKADYIHGPEVKKDG